jgi:hypothetical protein
VQASQRLGLAAFLRASAQRTPYLMLVFNEFLALDACDDRFGRGATKQPEFDLTHTFMYYTKKSLSA